MVNTSSLLSIDTAVSSSMTQSKGFLSGSLSSNFTGEQTTFAAELVAAVLTKIIEGNSCGKSNVFGGSNDAHNNANSDNFLKFQSSYEPDISIFAYLERIRKYSKCSDSVFILMLIYIDRLIENKGLVINRLNIHRLIITNMMVGAKYHDDLFYNNAYYAKLGGLTLSELNLLELEVLESLNYSMFVSNELFTKYSEQLNNYKFMIPTILASTNTHTLPLSSSPTAVANFPLKDFPHRVPQMSHFNPFNCSTGPVPAPVIPTMASIPIPHLAAQAAAAHCCLNAFQFSPHFVTPGRQISSGSISPGSISTVSSGSINFNQSVASYGNNAFSFSRSGSLDSFPSTNNITPPKPMMGHCMAGSFSFFDEQQECRWAAARGMNHGCQHPAPSGAKVFQHGGSYNNTHAFPGHYSQPQLQHQQMSSVPLVQFPTYSAPVAPSTAAPMAPYHLFPSVPVAPQMNYANHGHNYENNNGNYVNFNTRQGKSSSQYSKKRAHNDLYEDNNSVSSTFSGSFHPKLQQTSFNSGCAMNTLAFSQSKLNFHQPIQQQNHQYATHYHQGWNSQQ